MSRLPCEEQLNMLGFVLKDRWMPFRRDGLWFLLPPADLKGVGFRLLNLEWQKMSATGIQYSNSFNLSEAGGALGSSLTVMWKVAQGEGEAPC